MKRRNMFDATGAALPVLVAAVLLILQCVHAVNEHHLTGYHIDINAVSVSAFAFNSRPGYSKWVGRLFRGDAVYWGEKSAAINQGVSRNNAIDRLKENYRNESSAAGIDLVLPSFSSQCSIEVLGHVSMKMPAPFPAGRAANGHGVGVGTAWISPAQLSQDQGRRQYSNGKMEMRI